MRRIVCILGLLAMVTGCGAASDDATAEMGGKDSTAENIAEIIAAEKTVPADFRETGFLREEPPGYTYLVKQATDQEQYEELWTYFDFQEEAPPVDLDEKNVLFFSLEESGSCPSQVTEADVEANPKTETLEIQVSVSASEGVECSADATPRTFVMEITEETGPFSHVRVYENKNETTVPIK